MSYARTLIALGLAVALGVAHADLRDRGSYSSDTATGLDWLDLTQTSGLSYDAVIAGSFFAAGWRYANGDQVAKLFSMYTGKEHDVWSAPPPEMSGDLIRQLGVTYSINNAEGAYQVYDPKLPVQILTGGRFYDGKPNGYVGIGQYFEFLGNGASIWSTFRNELPVGDPSPYYGSFLVRETTVVPEPATVALMLTGLACVALTRRRRKMLV